jgi:hypothetical protein
MLYNDFLPLEIACFTPLSQPGKIHKRPQKKPGTCPALDCLEGGEFSSRPVHLRSCSNPSTSLGVLPEPPQSHTFFMASEISRMKRNATGGSEA